MRNRNNTRGESPFLEFVKKYWLVIVAIIVGTPVVLRYLKDAETQDKVNTREENEKQLASANGNPIDQKVELDKVTTNQFYHNLARNLSINLGTDIQTKDASWLSWFNPRGWTENDQKVYDDLKQIINTGQRTKVIEAYYVLTRRNLMDDVKKLLDSDLLAKLPLFK